MKFDVIIGNPPYQAISKKSRGTSGSKLYPRFVFQSLDYLSVGGMLVFVTPPGIFKTTDLRKESFLDKVTSDLCLDWVISSVNSYFNVGTPICVYAISNRAYSNLTRIDNTLINLSGCKFIPRVLGRDIATAISLSKKLMCDGSKFNFVRGGEPTKYFVGVRRLNHIGSGKFQIIIPPDNPFGDDLVHNVNNQEEIDNIVEYLNSPLMKFVNIVFRFDNVIYHNFLNAFCIPPKRDMYAHFNLTQEEIDLIERTVK